MIPALYTDGRLVTGCHHGDAYSKLSEADRGRADLLSGFIDPQTLKFVCESCEFYLKTIILVRHAQAGPEHQITEEGLCQADHTGDFLRRRFNMAEFALLSSPAPRCSQTASVICTRCNQHYVTNAIFGPRSVTETEQAFLQRVAQALELLPERAVIVSHSDFIRNMIQLAVGVEAKVPSVIPNCSVSYIVNHHAIWLAREDCSK